MADLRVIICSQNHKALYMEKKKKKETDSRQQVAADWILENYLQFNRLRVDTVRQRIQIYETPSDSGTPSDSPFKGGELRASESPSSEGGVRGGLGGLFLYAISSAHWCHTY